MEIPRHWRLKQQRYGLVGEVCPHCDVKIFPPRDVCPECGGEAKEPYTFTGQGTVLLLHDYARRSGGLRKHSSLYRRLNPA